MLEPCSRDSAKASYVDVTNFECALLSQYEVAYNYIEEAANEDECAMQCALGCKTTCHSFVFDDNKCKFVRTDIGVKDPKPFVTLTGDIKTTKVIKKAGQLFRYTQMM